MGISVRGVEEIARQWLMLSVISLCGCDYMFMCICVLHVDQRGACQCSSAAAISPKWAICRVLPRRRGCQVFFDAMWPLRLRDKPTPCCLMIPYTRLFIGKVAGGTIWRLWCTLWSRRGNQQQKKGHATVAARNRTWWERAHAASHHVPVPGTAATPWREHPLTLR